MDYTKLELTSQVANIKINCGYGEVPTTASCQVGVDGSLTCGTVSSGWVDGAQAIIGKTGAAAMPSFCAPQKK